MATWPNPPATWATDQVVTASDLNTQLRDALIAVLPIATLILRAAPYTTVETAVEGRWLQCNGAAVSRTTYSLLFDYLNALTPALPYGTGDGSTTFNLPDLRGRLAVAEGEHSNVDAMGDSDGAALANRQVAHYHNIPLQSSFTGSGSTAIYANDIQGEDGPAGANVPVGSTGGTEHTPAFLVVGSWFVKYV